MRVIHGGEISAFAKRGGLDEAQVIDFSSNINPLGLPDSVKETYNKSYQVISKYPDACARELHKTISEIHNLSAKNVLTGNGSISLIDLVIRSLKPKRALLVEPCFNEYRRLLELSNVHIDSCFLKEDAGFHLSFEIILDRLKETDLLILGHPNNPTGTALHPDQLAYLIEYANQKNKHILIDEAFIDWQPQNSVLSYVVNNSSLIVTRSLTKFFCLAGIRAGYACAHENMINRMRDYQETWGCNGLAQKLSVAALRNNAFQIKSLNWFEEEHAFMFERLSQISYIKVFRGKANFFLCKIVNRELLKEFWREMNRAGIYLREMHDFKGLDQNYFRVALKLRSENLTFLKILNSISKNKIKDMDTRASSGLAATRS